MRFIILVFIFVSLAGSSLAQQQPDPATLQKLLSVMQSQRNAALDSAAVEHVRAETLAEELARAKDDLAKAQAVAPQTSK